MDNPNRYFIIYKPYKMVSQFVSPDKVNLLGDLDYDFPEGIHAIGRLDNNSEGLLILTTNKKVTALLFQGEVPHKRTYLVQVEKPKDLPKRGHAFREDLPHTWLLISLTEGKYHQIRKMVSNVYHHCKRLIRTSIEDLELGDLQPGEVREIEEEEFFRKLKIENWRD